MNKLKLVLLLLIIFPLGLEGISQTKNQVELYVAPTISGVRYDRSYLNKYTSAVFRYDFGLIYLFRVKPKFRLGTGIGYSSMGYKYSYTYPGNVMGNTTSLEQNVYYTYIEFPIKFSSQIGSNAVNSFFIDFNLINQLLISTLTKYKEDNIEFDDKDSFKELRDNDVGVYSVAIQFVITYQKTFTNNLYFSLAPFFKYGILYSNDWSVGLKIAMGYNF